MSSPLANKVFLITGGTAGIGRAIATRAFNAGACVAVSYSRDSSAASSLASSLGNPSADRFLAIQADASSVADNEKLVDEVVKGFSGASIDVLIPNAGIMAMRDLAHVTEADFDSHFNLNVKGPMFLAQKAAPHMTSSESGSGAGGRIIFISTGVNKSSSVPPAYMLYAASKGAVDQMVRTMAKDPALAGRGITVNGVAPGPIGTELFFRGKPEGLVNMIKSWSPFNRLGEPDEIAKVVEFLGSDASSWVSGQILGVNGAMFV